MLKNDLLLPDLAKHIGRTQPYLSKALNGKGKLRVDEAFKLGDLLGMTAEEVREEFAEMPERM